MIGRPTAGEAAPNYFPYIDQVAGEDVLAVMESQLEEALTLFTGIAEEDSLHRYESGKWSMRQLLNHATD